VAERREDELMLPAEVATTYRVPDSTLRYWRHIGIGPEWIKVGRRVRYDRASVEAWLEQGRRTKTAI
jgi:DNA-binding transcriptional MerR regulator